MPPEDLTSMSDLPVFLLVVLFLLVRVGFPPLEILAGDSAPLLDTNLREFDLLTVQTNSSSRTNILQEFKSQQFNY